MKKCTEAVVNWLISHHAVTEDERSLYEYAVCSAFLFLFPLALAAGIGFCLGSIRQGLVLILPFVMIRKYSGGYHTKNLLSCIIGSGILLLLCIVLSMHVEVSWKLGVITGISVLSLVIFSPIENTNRMLDANEKRAYKRTTLILLMIFTVLAVVLFMAECYNYVICIFIGIQLTAILQIPCILKNICTDPKTD